MMKSFPRFPEPTPAIADELEKACDKNKCASLYGWIGKLKVLQEQLALYKKDIDD